jgi:hypothetical protein
MQKLLVPLRRKVLLPQTALKTTSEEVSQAAHTRVLVVRSGLQLQVGDGDEPRQVAIVAVLLPAIDHHVIAAKTKLLRNRMGG